MIISFIRRLWPARNLGDRFFMWRTDLAIDIRRLRSPIVIEHIPTNFYGYGEYLSIAILLRSPLGPPPKRLSDDELLARLEEF
ncbi:MAG: hypothetical protein AAGF75_10970 [Cyanobacteria bacterium P01_H01_bin.130]